MRRCHYCPSTELHLCRVHPADVILILFGARRRCEFCGNRQFHWWLPRPVRWALVLLLLGCGYVASAALVGRSDATPATKTRLRKLIYAPLVTLFESTNITERSVVKNYLGWLEEEEMSRDRLRLSLLGAQHAADRALRQIAAGLRHREAPLSHPTRPIPLESS